MTWTDMTLNMSCFFLFFPWYAFNGNVQKESFDTSPCLSCSACFRRRRRPLGAFHDLTRGVQHLAQTTLIYWKRPPLPLLEKISSKYWLW
jgi:hypothetical protein